MMKPLYQINDIWAGLQPVTLVSFKTMRKGQRVTRYRWRREDGNSVGIWAAPFVNEAQAYAAADRHPEFSVRGA